MKRKRASYYKVTDPKTIDRILDGRSGLSIGVLVEESHCTICGQEPSSCDHIPGDIYDGQLARIRITKMTPREASLVRVPDDPRCHVTALYIRTWNGRKLKLPFPVVRRKLAGPIVIKGIVAVAD